MYAPQLAWWLSFFPAHRFLVLPSALLHDEARQVEVRCEDTVDDLDLPCLCRRLPRCLLLCTVLKLLLMSAVVHSNSPLRLDSPNKRIRADLAGGLRNRATIVMQSTS